MYSVVKKFAFLVGVGASTLQIFPAHAEMLHLLCETHNPVDKTGKGSSLQYDVDTDRQEISFVGSSGISGVYRNEDVPGNKVQVVISSRIISIESWNQAAMSNPPAVVHLETIIDRNTGHYSSGLFINLKPTGPGDTGTCEKRSVTPKF